MLNKCWLLAPCHPCWPGTCLWLHGCLTPEQSGAPAVQCLGVKGRVCRHSWTPVPKQGALGLFPAMSSSRLGEQSLPCVATQEVINQPRRPWRGHIHPNHPCLSLSLSHCWVTARFLLSVGPCGLGTLFPLEPPEFPGQSQSPRSSPWSRLGTSLWGLTLSAGVGQGAGASLECQERTKGHTPFQEPASPSQGPSPPATASLLGATCLWAGQGLRGSLGSSDLEEATWVAAYSLHPHPL